ncbi:DUF3846 domain-containing protein [Nocardia brasiliensis]|uniref:DUF3846 domain-containing protein n=1 Tax=Nocardia brasiliensis TaxID=37326 RepID=UPI002454FE99|nr:DUF3846 domain-containing protein [Nocardia brasiliensis]
MRAVLIAPAEEPQKVEITGKSLDELYQILNCEYVEMIRLHEDTVMWFDGDAKATGKPRNEAATKFLQFAGGMYGDYVAGSILITGVDDEGEIAEADLKAFMDAVEAYEKNKDR